MKYADGSVYVGQWRKGVREGTGTFTAKTGYSNLCINIECSSTLR